MHTATGKGSIKSGFHALLLILMANLIAVKSWAVTGSDISLIDLMIDSYELKMFAWADQHAYSKDGPGIDARPQEVKMYQSLLHLDEYEGKLEASLGELSQSLQNFSVNWQEQKKPTSHFAKELESTQQDFKAFLRSKMSNSPNVSIRAEQIDKLLTLSSIYVFMASDASISFPITQKYNTEVLISSLDFSLSEHPVKDPTLLPKWRFLKSAFLREDYVAPLLVKRHALSMALILERSLDDT